MTIESWLPPTAMVALVLFIAREIFDLIKKKKADQRKVKALKAYLARECELIKWTILKLFALANDINTIGGSDGHLTVEKLRDGSFGIKRLDENGEWRSSYVIRFLDYDAFKKYFLDIASIDDDFFNKYEDACTAVAELRHVFDSLLDWERELNMMQRESFLASLAEYANVEIKEVEQTLTDFYKYCTGKPHLPHRLR